MRAEVEQSARRVKRPGMLVYLELRHSCKNKTEYAPVQIAIPKALLPND